MGNLARCRHEEKMDEVCGILTWKSSPSLEQNAKVKLHIHEAKLCICSAWFLMHLSSNGIKERCVDDGVTVRCSWVVYFLPCKGLVDNKYSRNIERIFEMIFFRVVVHIHASRKKNQVQRCKEHGSQNACHHFISSFFVRDFS